MKKPKSTKNPVFVPPQTKIKELAQMFGEEEARQKGKPHLAAKYAENFEDECLYESILPASSEFGKKVRANPGRMEKVHIEENPANNKVLSDNLFKIIKPFGPYKFIADSSGEREFLDDKQKAMRGLSIQVAQLYLETVGGINVRRKGSKRSDMEFKAEADSSAEERHDVEINRYMRRFVIAAVNAALYPLFVGGNSPLKDLERILMDVPVEDLRDRKKAEMFLQKACEELQKVFGTENVLKKIKFRG